MTHAYGRATSLIAATMLSLGMAGFANAQSPVTLTIATVNNGDMIVMQKLSPQFERQHPDIKLRWVVLEENVLRQRVTTDIATKAGQFDILTIGNYEVPIWAKQNWLLPMDNLPAEYAVDDLLKPVPGRPDVRGQVVWPAVLRRKRHDLLSQGPVPEGRHHDAGRPDLRTDSRLRRQDHRQAEPGLRHVPARQAGLG